MINASGAPGSLLQTGHLGQIACSPWIGRAGTGTRPGHPARGIARRLSESDVTELITRYREGATVYDLAERYGIHRTTVSATAGASRCGGSA